MTEFLSNLKITSRIMLMVFLFLFILVVTQGINLYQIQQAKNEIHQIAEKDIPIIKLISEITKSQLEQAVSFQRAVRFGKFMIINEEARKSYFEAEERSLEWDKKVVGQLNHTIQFVDETIRAANSSGERVHFEAIVAQLKKIRTDHFDYSREVEHAYEMIQASEFTNLEALAQAVEKKEDALNVMLRDLLKNIVQSAKESSEKANKRENMVQMFMYTLSIISVAVTLILGLAIARSIIGPLKYGSIIAKKISRGESEIFFPENTHDEIGQLMSTMNSMLGIIKDKENQLLNANAELENRVRERTLQLEEKNNLLAANNSELNKLNELKNEFLGIAAHDMRNPIAIIKGYADLLDSPFFGELPEPHKKVVLKIKESCVNMASLINNLLDISAIESGHLKLKVIQVGDVSKYLTETCQPLSLLARVKSVRLETQIPKDLPAVCMDPERINQVIGNLVTNAIKFSAPETTITLAARRGEGHTLLISVADQGKGISAQERELLFKKFSTTSTTPTSGEKSTGLGLAIVKKIIEAHQGKVWVESQIGKGSVFGFSLPVARQG